MSTGLNCLFIEIEPGRWYYLLEDSFAPKNAPDWREFATAYGPFATEDEGEEHLNDYHANPGGWSVLRFDPKRAPDELLRRLIDNAAAETARVEGSRTTWGRW